jgi:hypothetical protein
MLPNTDFRIHGPIENEAPTYWNVDLWTWVLSFEMASKFPRDILTLPLPEGTEGVMEYDPQGLFLNWFTPYPPPWGWQKLSQQNN